MTNLELPPVLKNLNLEAPNFLEKEIEKMNRKRKYNPETQISGFDPKEVITMGFTATWCGKPSILDDEDRDS